VPKSARGLLGADTEATGATPSGGLDGGLVVPGVQAIDGAQQQQAAQESRATSPDAVAARERSRTAYSNLDPQQAATLFSETFPELINRKAGGPPSLPSGETLKGFADANTAEVELGDHRGSVIESLVPMAVPTAHGWAPVDLSLHDSGSAFETANPLVPVRVPKHLNEGGQLTLSGLSMTPVDAQGVPLGGSEGVTNGTSVFFANTLTDSDTLMKPSPEGLEESTTLRSSQSPEQLYYRIGLPAGASLVPATDGSGTVRVLKEGTPIATIPKPTVSDATGAAVPASVAVSGNTLVVTVTARSGNFQYPLVVDPEFNSLWENVTPGDWFFHEWIGFHYGIGPNELWMHHEGAFSENDYAEWSAFAPGYTKIFHVYIKDNLYPTNNDGQGHAGTLPYLRAWVEIAEPNGENHTKTLSGSPSYLQEATVCSQEVTCSPEAAQNGNGERFGVTTGESSKSLEENGHSNEVNYGANATELATEIAQEQGRHSVVAYNTEHEITYETEHGEHAHAINVIATGGWLGPHNGAFGFTAEDGGLGVAETKLEAHPAGGWEAYGVKNFQEGTSSCLGVYCQAKQTPTYSYNTVFGNGSNHLPDGEYAFRVAARSPLPYSTSSEFGEGAATMKVDATPPHNLTLSGLAGQGENLELGEVEAHVKAEATDGEGTKRSSGVESVSLYVDGKEVGRPSGACTPGPCTALGEWELNGAELGSGTHTLTVKATDNAGNIATHPYQLTVYHAAPVAMGPGSVNPESGNFAMEATDASLGASMGTLSVSRHYDSLNPTEGAQSPLGPQWTIGLGSLAKLEVLPDNSVMVIGPEGLTHFTTNGTKFEAPPGDSNLTLEHSNEYEGKEPAYIFKNEKNGTTTVFRLPKGSTLWLPSLSKSPIATNTLTDEYKTVEESGKVIVEPVLELAPHPSVTCALGKFERGCRGLEFVYAKARSAKGEAESEWGDYWNRLKEVIAVAYNPSTKAIVKTPIAAYEYDINGRLRAEWDPRIIPALKTTYGYDVAGHVTSLNPPGQETWAFTYGPIAGDANSGRLLKVTRAPLGASLWNGSLPSNTEQPAWSGTSRVGNTISVSTGKWTNEPTVYGYQWIDCNPEGTQCTPIPGATNPNYTVAPTDLGQTLFARVTATNGGGSKTENSEGHVVSPPKLTYGSQFGTYGTGNGQFELPRGITRDAKGNLWVADSLNYRIQEFTPQGTFIKAFGSEGKEPGQFNGPEALAFDQKGNVWVADTNNSRVEEFTESGAYMKMINVVSGSDPGGIAIDREGNVWVSLWADYTVVEYNANGEQLKSVGTYKWGQQGPENLFEPGAIAFAPNGNLIVDDGGNHRIAEFTPSGTPVRDFGEQGTGPGQFNGAPRGVSVTEAGDLWVTDLGDHRIEEFTEEGGFLGEYGTKGTGNGQFEGPVGTATDPVGDVWVSDLVNQRIVKLEPEKPEQVPHIGPQPGATIEYGVPLEGGAAPAQLGVNETTHKPEPEKWAQTDDPQYATAILPQRKPMGWPATAYTGATTYYMDRQARTVNVASPTGGITTSEYSPNNDVTRTLSATARAAALSEPNPAEASLRFDTKSAYDTAGHLTDVWGPQHTVKLAAGKKEANEEALARNHIKYFYNEGAPGGEQYDLVTKSIDGAETASKEEFDKRTELTSYSGQSNLGWKLRVPTSVTTDPGGLNLTSTTIYDPNTGNVVETKSPAGTSGGTPTSFAYASQFGSTGAGNGQLNTPREIARDSKGDIWAADSGNNRVEEFNEKGEYVSAFGTAGSGAGQLRVPKGVAIDAKGDIWVSDTGNNRVEEFNEKGEYLKVVGALGTGNGQFVEPKGLTIDSHNNVWVLDGGNSRVEEFNEKGEFIKAVGSAGSGNGQLATPKGVPRVDVNGNLWVADSGNSRVEEFNAKGEYVKTVGTYGHANGQMIEPKGIVLDSHNDVFVADPGNHRVEMFNEKGEYQAQFGTEGTGNGQFEGPWGLEVDPRGDIYVSDESINRIQVFTPSGSTGSAEAHDHKTAYYTAKGESEVAVCQSHPEWVGLPCQTRPAAQPGTTGLPPLPVTTITYNMWNQAEKTEEVFGTVTRTKINTFDSADRPSTTEETASAGEPLHKITDTYEPTNGTLRYQSTQVGPNEITIEARYNALGELQAYHTPAGGNGAAYEYDQNGRLIKLNDALGAHQTYEYDETTGLLVTLVDSTVGTFKATYDVAGGMTSESYPNGMTATSTYNLAGT
jgi:YD repeat-containing protein